jgi:hypothetical protein
MIHKSTFSIPRPSKIYPNLDIWCENIPSGNPAADALKVVVGVKMSFFRVSDPLVPLLLHGTPFFRLFFLIHHLVNRDDQHLLAHEMASDFSAAW